MTASATGPLLLWHTMRHLRARQVAGQLRLRWGGPLRDPARYAAPHAPFPGCRWHPLGPFLPAGGGRTRITELLDGNFRFVNRSEHLGWPPRWDGPDLPRLWLYNLHYFEWLAAMDYDRAREATLDWIERHRAGRRSVGWEPYPLSLRLVNWCIAFWQRWRRRTEDDAAFRDRLWVSTRHQAQWLARHPEYHLMGNHLLENAVALAVAGSCFEGPEAGHWRAVAARLLAREIPEQLLGDGMHFERSPMYHLRATWLLAALVNLDEPALTGDLRSALRRALAATAALRHPDGRIALLNDSAFGIYNEPEALLAWGGRLLDEPQAGPPLGAWALPDAGYYGWRDEAAYVVCDAGPVGPDYMPGHAHGDLLSFELSWRGHRVFVDSGVHDYVPGAMREYCRSTRAHNTVELDDRDQCEFWGAFRVGRRARPLHVEWRPSGDGFELAASHDGYRRLAGRPEHRRTFRWQASGLLELLDAVRCGRPTTAVARLHLHPDCRIESIDDDAVRVTGEGGALRIGWRGWAAPVREESWYCPEFGSRRRNPCLAFRAIGSDLQVALRIECDA